MNETKWSSSWAAVASAAVATVATVAISQCVLNTIYITHCSDFDKNRIWQQLLKMFSHCTCPDPFCPGLLSAPASASASCSSSASASAHSSFIHSIFRLRYWICTEYLRLAASESLFKLTSFMPEAHSLRHLASFLPLAQCTHWKWIMVGIMIDIHQQIYIFIFDQLE